MKHHTSLSLILLLLFAFLLIPANATAQHFRHLGLSNGLSQPSVMSISQDFLGRMWFGTREGVNVYDGTSIRSFKGWVKDPVSGKNVWIGNWVYSIAPDSKGDMYLLIDKDIIKYDTRADRFIPFVRSNAVRAMAEYKGELAYISNDSLFSGTKNGGKFLFKIPPINTLNSLCVAPDKFYICSTAGLTAFDKSSRRGTTLLPGINVISAYLASNGTLWICTENEGVFCLRPHDKTPVQVSLPTPMKGALGAHQTRRAIEDQYGRIWYGSFSGLFCYDPVTQTTNLIESPNKLNGLSHSSIYGLYHDKNGTIWAGSYYGGVNYFNPGYDPYYNFDYKRVAQSGLHHSLIIDMVYDRDGNLWMGTDGGGVSCVDADWKLLRHLSTLSGANALRQNNIKVLEYDSARHRVYIGTHMGGLSYFDIPSGRTVNLIDSSSALPGSVILHLQIHGKNLYISSRKGLCRMNLDTGETTPLSREEMLKFSIDPQGNLWYISNKRLCTINVDGKAPYKLNKTMQQAVVDFPTDIQAVPDGIVCGTAGNGLVFFNLKSGEVKHIDSNNSALPSDYCYSLATDAGGAVYIATDGEIVKWNPKNDEVRAINFGEFFPESHIIAECGLITRPDGSVLAGSTQGITVLSDKVFEEDQNESSAAAPKMFFANLKVGNHDVLPNDGSGILAEALPYARKIKLKPNQNSFSLTIAHPEFSSIAAANRRFQYRLENVDKDWQMAHGNTVHYTNLTPGTYTLYARPVSASGQPLSEGISLKVVVAHPWYATWWAWLLYILVLGSVGTYIFRRTQVITRLRSSLHKEQLERQQIEKLNQEKLVFFTNVSHEFQTPLTLILSHIDMLLARSGRQSTMTHQLGRIRAHAEQMSHLVTQLLEFRKFQSDSQVMRIGQHDAGAALKEVASPFMDYAERRGIRFSVDIPQDSPKAFFDPQLLNRVLVNILSNAFKYTPDGGMIECSVAQDGDTVKFSFTDNGKGIPANELPYVFDRFYNGSADEINQKDLDFKSTGIGLAFAKSIVDKHHGHIAVQSTEGVGSTFIVEIPATRTPYAEDENVVFDDTLTPAPYESHDLQIRVANNEDDVPMGEDANAAQPLILIAEDNDELREQLAIFFSTYYRVMQAADGAQAIQMAKACNPDIIISDVLMPNMSGTELCRTIKSDTSMCHIPVILLTALSGVETRLEGLNANADDYVTKPYDSSVLLARVDNLLRNRRLLQKQFENKPISEIDISVVHPLDRDILQRTSEIIDQHLADPDFDIPALCSELAMSKSLFYNKFKSLTGLTPNAFILNYRLKHAAQMLTSQASLSITDIADRTGFATAVYFSRCFKKQYGVPPQKYREDNSQKPEA